VEKASIFPITPDAKKLKARVNLSRPRLDLAIQNLTKRLTQKEVGDFSRL
jgi:hypothetical protein